MDFGDHPGRVLIWDSDEISWDEISWESDWDLNKNHWEFLKKNFEVF